MTTDLPPPPLADALTVLAPLLGTWRGAGEGHYPTIESFSYREEVTFGHVGKPFLAYRQGTRDASTGAPLHAEVGYFRPVGTDGCELVIAQPSGIVEVHGGTVTSEDGALRLDLTATTVATTATAKSVTAVRRIVIVEGERLTYDLEMAAVDQPLQHHLHATLTRDP